MIFEDDILESFKKLGKTPWGNQVKHINDILTAYIVDQKKIVILSAPTGLGKSIIGAVVADVLHTVISDLVSESDPDFNRCASFILSQNNMLTAQYHNTFAGLRNFCLVKGANNYKCEALSTSLADENAESCCEYDMKKSKESDLLQIVNKYCSVCEYSKIKKTRHFTDHIISNYSYFFVDRLFANSLAYRTITVWDEAHTINETFAEHCAIFVSEKRLVSYAQEIGEAVKLSDNFVLGVFAKIRDGMKSGKINDSNYLEYLEELHKAYTTVKVAAKLQAEAAMSFELKEYTKLNKLSKKYGDLACKIGDLLDFAFEHVFELNKEAREISVKPIFVGPMFNQLINSEYQLFMSATVSKELLVHTLGLDPSEVAFIKLPSEFPIENKKVVFLNIAKLNYNSMKDVVVIDKINSSCLKLTQRHIDAEESGIIICPSFAVTQTIAEHLRRKGITVYEHQSGSKLAPLVEQFKLSKSPSVLISPSLFEGVSLDDEISRFQIFVKCPYASLGEKRVKYIADKHSTLYELQTILRIIQGAGRSVRGPEDYAVTYCLDSNLSWIWKSELNVWRDEFSVSFQSLI